MFVRICAALFESVASMRYWTLVQPKNEASDPEYVTLSEEDIRQEYWPYWYKKMCEKFGQEKVDQDYCFEDCLTDWVTVHWAWPSDNQGE